jgi:hypothetical protein
MSTSSIYSVDKLEASNFSSWKLRLKMILIDRGLWEVVDGTELKPAPDNKALYDAFIKKDNQALAQIVLTLSNSQLVHVRNASSSRDAWRNICSAFEAKGLAAKVYLRRQFFTIKFTDSGSM